MKIIQALLLLVTLSVAMPAEAAPPSNPSRWALGFMVGEPTGLTLKKWLGGPNAFDVGVGTGPGLRLHADYLFGLARLARESSMNLDLYVGVGGVVGVNRGYCGWIHGDRFCHRGDDAFGGVRVPFGLDFVFKSAPLELGLEIAPGIWVSRPVYVGLMDANLFVRFLL